MAENRELWIEFHLAIGQSRTRGTQPLEVSSSAMDLQQVLADLQAEGVVPGDGPQRETEG